MALEQKNRPYLAGFAIGSPRDSTHPQNGPATKAILRVIASAQQQYEVVSSSKSRLDQSALGQTKVTSGRARGFHQFFAKSPPYTYYKTSSGKPKLELGPKIV